jgi:hypothetical protein
MLDRKQILKINLVLFAYIPDVENSSHTLIVFITQSGLRKKALLHVLKVMSKPDKMKSLDSITSSSPQKIQ